MQPRIHHLQRIQLQVVHGDTHAGGDFGGVGALELHANALLPPEHEQIELGALVGGPEEGFVGPRDAQHLLQRKTLLAFLGQLPRRP